MRVMKKRILSLFLCLTFVAAAGALGGTKLEVQAANNVTPSKKEYEVELFKGGVYLGNQKGVDVSGGEAVYLTYTVDSVMEDAVKQCGLVTTADCSKDYPYVDGIMQYNNQKNLLMKPGYTYFIKFQVTEFGFEYVVVYSNGEDEAYETGFLHTTGELKDNLQYCGIWLGQKIIAYLTHVRCYDAKGNDLGLTVKSGVINDPTFKPNPNVEHSYEFTVTDAKEVAVSSSKYSRADEIFMEYEVKDVTNTIKQTGFITTNTPTSRYRRRCDQLPLQQEDDARVTSRDQGVYPQDPHRDGREGSGPRASGGLLRKLRLPSDGSRRYALAPRSGRDADRL